MAGLSMSRRTIALLLAVILAALATIALVSYTRSLKNKAFEGRKTVEVFVAKEDIPAGVTGDSAIERGLIGTTTVPERVAADQGIRTLDEIKGKIAAVNIIKGEQILAARFVAPGQAGAGGVLLAIPPDRQAISVEVNFVPGVAGFIQKGNHINILAQLTVTRGGRTGPTETKTQFLLQNIEVLEVGARVITTPQGPQQNQSTGKVLVTLAVTPADAEKLAYAIFQGQLYFTLLPPGGKSAKTPGRTQANAFS